MAKIWHEPQHRQRPVSRKQNFVRGGSNWKVIAPGVLVICPLDKNRGSTKKLSFGPKYQSLGVKIVHFCPSGPLGPCQSMFSTQKRCFIGSPIWGYQQFCSLPKILGFLAQGICSSPANRIFGPKLAIFAQKYALLVIFGQLKALPALLVPCWLAGCWLWRAGCSYDWASTVCVMFRNHKTRDGDVLYCNVFQSSMKLF